MQRFAMRCFTAGLACCVVMMWCGSTARAQGVFGANTGGAGINVGNGSGLQGIGSVGQVDSSARYLRSNQDGTMVGASETGSFVGSSGASTGRGGTQSGVGGGRRNTGNVNRGNTRSRSAEIPSALRVGFSFPRPTPMQTATVLQQRIQQSEWISPISPISVTIDQGTVVLRGAVADAQSRSLVERVVLLEPGIYQVVNELDVVEQ